MGMEKTLTLTSFQDPIHVALFGANGGIGQGFLRHLAADPSVETVHAFSRRGLDVATLEGGDKITPIEYQPDTEDQIADAIQAIKNTPINLAIVTIGTLHDAQDGPEKAIKDLTVDRFLEVMRVNAALPAMIGKHLMPQLKERRKTVFAALSARVGSISDNRLGGWHSYRASKAALNQLVRNMAIEIRLRNKDGIAVTLHPGTVDTGLSEPFQKNVPAQKLFTPEYSTAHMLSVLNGLTPEDSGKCFDFAGKEVQP